MVRHLSEFTHCVMYSTVFVYWKC